MKELGWPHMKQISFLQPWDAGNTFAWSPINTDIVDAAIPPPGPLSSPGWEAVGDKPPPQEKAVIITNGYKSHSW